MFDWKCQSVAKHCLCFRHTLYSRHNFIHMSVRKWKGKVKSDTNDQLRQIAKAQRSNASLQCSGNCAQSSFLDKLTSALFRRQWLTESRLAPFCPAFVSPCANISPGLKGYYAVCCSVQCGNIVDVHFNAATVQCALKRRHQCGNIADVQLATRMWVQRQSSLRVLTALRNCF